jgi:hypothetical protein
MDIHRVEGTIRIRVVGTIRIRVVEGTIRIRVVEGTIRIRVVGTIRIKEEGTIRIKEEGTIRIRVVEGTIRIRVVVGTIRIKEEGTIRIKVVGITSHRQGTIREEVMISKDMVVIINKVMEAGKAMGISRDMVDIRSTVDMVVEEVDTLSNNLASISNGASSLNNTEVLVVVEVVAEAAVAAVVDRATTRPLRNLTFSSRWVR